MAAASAAPKSGASQNSHSWPRAQESARNTTDVARAGFRDPLLNGIVMLTATAKARPMAMGPRLVLLRAEVTPRIMAVRTATATISTISTPTMGTCDGEWASKPLASAPNNLGVAGVAPAGMTFINASHTTEASRAPTVWATMYSAMAENFNRPATAMPNENAGLK